MVKSSGLAGEGDLAVDIDPIVLHGREDFSHSLADRLTARDAQDLLKCRVNFQVTEITRLAIRVQNDLAQGESFPHRLEQGPVLFFTHAQRLIHLLALGDVAGDAGRPGNLSLIVQERGLDGFDPGVVPAASTKGSSMRLR